MNDYKSIKIILDQIKNKIKIEDYIVKELNIPLKYYGSSSKFGARYSTPCPIHGGTNNGSFFVLPQEQIFKCFGCLAQGDIIKFAMLYRNSRVSENEKWKWFDSLNYFASRFGITCEISDVDIVERILNEYLRDIQAIESDIIDPLSINWEATNECKKILNENNYSQLELIAEKIYKVVDNCIIDFESTDKKIFNKTRENLFYIKNDLLPSFKKFVNNVNYIKNELKELEIKNKSCTSCYLRHNCNKVVVGEGNFLSKVMIIGEAPGKEEDEQGRPFVGSSGSFLRNTIKNCGFDDKNIWIDNISNCRPSSNKFQDKEAFICKKLWFNKRVEIIKPIAIMLMGNNAAKVFLEDSNFKISDWIGKTIEHNSIKIWFNYHPSFLIRNGGELSDKYNQFCECINNFLKSYIKET